MAPYSSEDFDGFIIFGGTNLRNYCKSNMHYFNFLNFGGDIKDAEPVPMIKEEL